MMRERLQLLAHRNLGAGIVTANTRDQGLAIVPHERAYDGGVIGAGAE